MKRLLLNFLLFTAICIALCTCSNSNQNTSKENLPDAKKRHSNYKKKNFDSLMSAAEKGMPLDYYEELLANKAFVEIFEHSSSYFDDVIKLLSKEKFTNEQLTICTYAMQNLDTNDYVGLCGLYVELYNHHKISEGVLEEIIMPDFLQKRIIAKNYADPNVIKVLNTIHNSKNISKNFKEIIESILSGKFLKDIEAGP